MAHRSRRFYALATIAYLAVVAALVLLALFARGATERLGEVRVAARYRAWPLLGSTVRRASIGFRGLSLSFDLDHPLTVGESSVRLEEVRAVSDGVDLVFQDVARLELRRSDDGYSLALATSDPASASGSIVIPFRAPGVTQAPGDVPALGWNRGGEACYVSLPAGSTIDQPAGLLELSLPADGRRELRFGSSGTAAQVLAARWLSDQASLIDAAGWQRAVAAFRDAAWRGWTRERVSGDGTLWKAADGSWSFVDPIGPSMLAEALARGAYLDRRAAAIAAMSRQLEQATDRAWSLSASPYLGWIGLYAERLQAREAGALARIRDRIASGDPSVFSTPALVPYVLDHGVLADLQALMGLADRLAPGDLDATAAVGALEAWLDYALYVDDSGHGAARARAIIEQRILPSTRETDHGLHFAVASDRVDTALSIACGKLLERAALLLADDRLLAIARTVVASSIGLVRPGGFLPATLRLSGDRVSSQEGLLAPEAVYEKVGDDRYLPREIPLYRAVGPGAWIWTVARLGPVEASVSEVRITIGFPPGLPHYMLVSGLRPFKELRLHGTPWQSDPAFAQSPDGWSWDSSRGLLSLKLTGREESEEVVIVY